MKRSIWIVLLALSAIVLLLVGWQAVAMSLPNRDDEAAEKLAEWDAAFVRGGSPTPLTFIAGGTDNRGDILLVTLSGKITTEQVEVLLSLRSCERVCLNDCTFADHGLLSRLGGMPSLQVLQLIHHTVTDQELARALPHFGRLRSLYLQDNDITDASVDALAGVPHLRWVCIAGTKITPAGVVRLKQLRPELDVDTTLQPPF